MGPSDRSRPTLGAQLLRELWARAAGRCEFRGCNALLYTDELTQQRSNLATIAHIVAFKENGPRGHSELSKKLEKDISNLMLTCKKHGKLIDDKDKEDEYPIELLRAFKREHEERIRRLTSITEDARTHVLIVQARIHGRTFAVDTADAHRAVLPLYPTNETGHLVDLTDIPLKESSPGYWPVMSAALKDRLAAALKVGPRGQFPRQVSVFALAPIPLLVVLGEQLDDKSDVLLHQRHRGRDPWAWRREDEHGDWFEVFNDNTDLHAQDVALVLSISDKVKKQSYRRCFQGAVPSYEIRATKPGVDFLKSKERLERFAEVYREVLCEIRARHGHTCSAHLFAAVPAPVAIKCGQHLLHKTDPRVLVYEYHKDHGFSYALTVNDSER